MANHLPYFEDAERSCVERFLALLHTALGDGLVEVWLFGSFARGDVWSRRMPMNSDIDVLVLTSSDVGPETREALLNETYPLYLECGRQISPQFWSTAKFDDPPSEAARTFKALVVAEGKRIFPVEPEGRPR
jgi:predicted nucleotidyltransferase